MTGGGGGGEGGRTEIKTRRPGGGQGLYRGFDQLGSVSLDDTASHVALHTRTRTPLAGQQLLSSIF